MEGKNKPKKSGKIRQDNVEGEEFEMNADGTKKKKRKKKVLGQHSKKGMMTFDNKIKHDNGSDSEDSWESHQNKALKVDLSG